VVNASQRVFGMPEMVIEMCATFLLLGSMSECPPKEKSLDFLGFVWPNRDLSMGYGESK